MWLNQIDHGASNLFGEPLSAQTAEGPRGIVAAATGLALVAVMPGIKTKLSTTFTSISSAL